MRKKGILKAACLLAASISLSGCDYLGPMLPAGVWSRDTPAGQESRGAGDETGASGEAGEFNDADGPADAQNQGLDGRNGKIRNIWNRKLDTDIVLPASYDYR